MIGGNKKDELVHLKGDYEALESAAIQKECEIAETLKAAREKTEAEAAEKEDASQSATEDF